MAAPQGIPGPRSSSELKRWNDIVKGMKSLERSRKRLADVKTVLVAAAGVVKIVARIVDLTV